MPSRLRNLSSSFGGLIAVSGQGLRRCALAACLGTLAVLTAPGMRAHKLITSKYTYNDHVFPILRDRCGQCHVEGGPTPMSLMTYKAAAPWVESIREQLVSEAMPPWYVDPLGPPAKGGHLVSARELDVLVTWAVGGAPEGDPANAPAPVAMRLAWKAGPPDVTFRMPSMHTLPAGTIEDVYEFTVRTNLTEDRWVRAADLLPGTPTMLRAASIAIDGGALLAAWVPGYDPSLAPSSAAFRLVAGASLHVRMVYRKHWQDESVDKSDQSTIGLYFSEPPVSGRGIETLAIHPAPAEASSTRTLESTLKMPVRVMAVQPYLDQAYASVAVEAILPTGRRVALLRLRAARPRWERRYWLADPVELPRGTTIEATAVPAPADESAPASRPGEALKIAVDYTPL